MRAAAGVEETGVEPVMRALGQIAVEALLCEVAAVFLADGDRLEVIDRGFALREVLRDGHFPYCVQNASVAPLPLPVPLDAERGIRSYYLLELKGLARGVMFVAHTDSAPAQLSVELTREWCSTQAARLHAEFGKLDAS